MGQRR